jgi:iron complex transport system substrate-binding protein
MIKKNLLTVLISLLLFGSCTEKKEIEPQKNFITDDLHKKIEIEFSPQKVITLAPNLTELVFELGEGNKIIGNTNYCNYPNSAKKIENVADLLSVNLEKITVLQPDLIFITAEGNSKSDYNKLVELGFKVFVSNPRNFNGIKKTLLDMGRIFDVSGKAEAIVNNWNARIDSVKKTHYQIVSRTVMFLISTNPIYSVGKNTFVNQILTFAGLENITADTDVNYPLLNREEILVRNPSYILLYETNNNDVHEILNAYPEWNILSAVINNRVFFINADLFSRPGPRFIDAVENLNKLVLNN